MWDAVRCTCVGLAVHSSCGAVAPGSIWSTQCGLAWVLQVMQVVAEKVLRACVQRHGRLMREGLCSLPGGHSAMWRGWSMFVCVREQCSVNSC
jgi:hypothetical protein